MTCVVNWESIRLKLKRLLCVYFQHLIIKLLKYELNKYNPFSYGILTNLVYCGIYRFYICFFKQLPI